MALQQHTLEDQYRPLSELTNYTIEKGDPDPRGYSVVSIEGRRVGTVEDLIVDTSTMKVRYLVVDIEESGDLGINESRILLDVSAAHIRDERREVFARELAGGTTAGAFAYPQETAVDTGQGRGSERVLTRAEEELRIGKREVSRGEARVSKHVETERVSAPVTRRREEVVIERRPVEAGARGDADISSDEIRIPLTEEEVVVEKRPVVKEELVVGKRVVEERDVIETEVRKEEFDIETPVAPGRSKRSTS